MLFQRFRAGFFLLILSVGFSAGCVAQTRSRDVFTQETRVPILLYHHVAPITAALTPDQKRWTVSPEQFEEQLKWLKKRGYQPVTMAGVSANRKNGSPLPARPVVITFDDGWKDQYTFAFPLLKKHGFSATFFVITNSVGRAAYVNWDECRQMSRDGMDIQSHGLTHARLSVLSFTEALREIQDSKKVLEAQLHQPVTVFAYPYGSYDEDVLRLVREAGYDTAAAITGRNGGYIFRSNPSWTLLRYAVENSDKLEYISMLKEKKSPVFSSLFVSLVQEPDIFSSREGIEKMLDFASRARIRTLFIQVYRENKSWFASQTADEEPFRQNLKHLSEDPLALIIREAHKRGIEVHAWMNMLSLSQNRNAPILKKYGMDVLTRNLKSKKEDKDYLIDHQYFLEPGDPGVRRDLSRIVEELLKAYPELDGIQFDYIRYPDQEPHYGYSPENVSRFRQAAGLREIDEDSLAWKNWKRNQVTELLALLTRTARNVRPDIQVSATGCMPLIRAQEEAYQDWPVWLDQNIVDFVTLMDYSPHPREFSRWLSVVPEKVKDLSRVKVGVGAYKLVESPWIFEQESRAVQKDRMTASVFHYGSLLENPQLQSLVIRLNRPPVCGDKE